MRSPHPYLARETAGLSPGTALDAGCGPGAEAIWLAAQGWQVTAADISAQVIAQASASAEQASVSELVTWVEADLTIWEPQQHFDLVTTSYAHSSMPQLEFYQRIANWVVPGGTLVVVGHLHDPSQKAHSPVPEDAEVTLADIAASFDLSAWRIDTAEEHTRTVPGNRAHTLRDVVVRARRHG